MTNFELFQAFAYEIVALVVFSSIIGGVIGLTIGLNIKKEKKDD